MKLTIKLMLSVSTLAMSTVGMTATLAQDSKPVVEELTVIGSRSTKPRSASDSPVPVDVINAAQFNAMGNTADITDNLKAMVPSFNATPATGDGSAFVRPTSMRGMAPDQTLVLVNGKRRHRSSLVTFFAPAAGNGSHGVDIGMIPSGALKRVEVLRDGAAAQYGSDAIAGVINFVLNDANEGGAVQAQYGNYYKGEESYKVSANAGFALGDDGFLNITGEYVDNQALSRGIVDSRAQALIDAGVQGVGSDTPFGDAPKVQTWGRPETSATRMFVNSGVAVSDTADFYMHGNYAETKGRYRFFFRGPDHSTITNLVDTYGWTSTLPAGFTPYLDGTQTDVSIVGGLKGEFGNGMLYDVSAAYGKNSLDYFLNNTLNGDLDPMGGEPQRDFNVGGFDQEEVNFNADFSYEISDTVNLAFGLEHREETFSMVAGEPNSSVGSGTSGFTGIKANESFSRKNGAIYMDVEHDINEDFLMQYALRFEKFAGFGNTLNGKVAARYNVNEDVTLRGAVSTGFHAPTPGQANITSTITTFNSGLQVEEGLIPATDPVAVALGGKALTEEKSTNYSFGMSSAIGNNSALTVDYYRIDVNDRIYRTGTLPVVGAPGATISFYTNALDTRSQGVDVVLTSTFDMSDDATTDLSFAFNYNKFEVTGQHQVSTPGGLVTPVSDGTVDDIEKAYPTTRFVVSTNTQIKDKWNFMMRANYFGSHYDQRGLIGDTVGAPSAKVGASIYFDMELGYDIDDNMRLAVGAVNVFDSYVDKTLPPNASYSGNGLEYPRWSAANYEGGSWYVKLGYKF